MSEVDKDFKGYVEFTHTNWRGSKLYRKVIPHKVFYGEYPITCKLEWVLQGFCLDKKAIRSFLLDGVEDINKLLLDLEGKVVQTQLSTYLEELK